MLSVYTTHEPAATSMKFVKARMKQKLVAYVQVRQNCLQTVLAQALANCNLRGRLLRMP